MGRGSEQASGAATSAQNISNVSGGNAGALYSTLAPALESQMANPQGFNPVDLARMNTATMQTAGGTQSAAMGAGSLRAARTGNVGGSDAAIADAARKGGEIASEGALGTQIKNAQLKQHQHDEAALTSFRSASSNFTPILRPRTLPGIGRRALTRYPTCSHQGPKPTRQADAGWQKRSTALTISARIYSARG